MVSKLKRCGLGISGYTVDHELKKGKGIIDYLEAHSEIEEFVILDDKLFDFKSYKKLWKRLLITKGIECAKYASRTPAVEAILFLDYIKFFS